jgi:hypothetical protein
MDKMTLAVKAFRLYLYPAGTPAHVARAGKIYVGLLTVPCVTLLGVAWLLDNAPHWLVIVGEVALVIVIYGGGALLGILVAFWLLRAIIRFVTLVVLDTINSRR